MRQCGGCRVCCYVGAVPEISKGPHAHCKHECAAGCAIIGQPARPSVCKTFECSWLHGLGTEDDRPDKGGVMFSVNMLEGRMFGVAMEQREGALRASSALVEFARHTNRPVIAMSVASKPPSGGDFVVVTDALLPKTEAMRGAFVAQLADDVQMYELRAA